MQRVDETLSPLDMFVLSIWTLREKHNKSIRKWKLWLHFTKTGRRLRIFSPNWKIITLKKGEEEWDIIYWFQYLNKISRIRRDTKRIWELIQFLYSTCNKITMKCKIVKNKVKFKPFKAFKLLTCKQVRIRLELSFLAPY